jgi:hypothetical protein
MHLLTFMQMRQPGFLFRSMVLLGQGVVFNAYLLSYVLSPRTCHAFVGYLEEEAVKTYTRALKVCPALYCCHRYRQPISERKSQQYIWRRSVLGCFWAGVRWPAASI